MQTIKCKSIQDAYIKGIDYVIRTGKLRKIHGTDVLQADEVCLDINIDNDDDYCNLAPLKEQSAETYLHEFLNPDRGEHPYTYGERIVNYHGINQLAHCVKVLRNDRYTRQAVCSVWNQVTDEFLDDPPCLQHIQFYFNNADEFVIKVLFRSHDFYQALIYNLQGLKYTGTYVASMINEQPKRMILDSARPHIYWYNIDYCKQITQR